MYTPLSDEQKKRLQGFGYTPIGKATATVDAPVPAAGSTSGRRYETTELSRGIASVATNPLTVARGTGKGLIDFTLSATRTIADIFGQERAAQYIADNRTALDQIFESNLKDEGERTAGAVGEFIGEQVPYLLGGAGLTALGVKASIPLLVKYGGGLSAKAISSIGIWTKMATNVAGFIGLDQLVFEPGEESRTRAVGKDLLVLGVFEAVAAGTRGLLNRRSVNRVRDYLERVRVEKPQLASIEAETKALAAEVADDIGKSPSEIVGEALQKGDIDAANFPRQVIEKVTKATELSKGDIVASDEVGTFIVQGTRRVKTPTGIQTFVTVKDRSGNILENESELFHGFERRTYVSGKSVAAVAEPSVPASAAGVPAKVGAVEGLPVEPTVTRVSRSQLPVGTGEERISRLEARIRGKLDSATPEERADLSTYFAGKPEERLREVAKYVVERPDDAMDILMGRKPAPKGFLKNDFYVALANSDEALVDMDLTTKLASLQSTRFGQEIEVLKHVDPHSAVRYLSQISRNRVEALGGRDKVAHLIEREVAPLRKAVQTLHLGKSDWDSFVTALRC